MLGLKKKTSFLAAGLGMIVGVSLPSSSLKAQIMPPGEAPRLGPQAPMAPPQGAPAAPAGPAAPGGLGPVVGDARIVAPASMRVGEKMRVMFEGLPNPSSRDQFVVVEAGSPDNNPKNLTYAYASNRPLVENGWEIGPFAPGQYEVRWMTTLYNNDLRLEVGARAPFSVTR